MPYNGCLACDHGHAPRALITFSRSLTFTWQSALVSGIGGFAKVDHRGHRWGGIAADVAEVMTCVQPFAGLCTYSSHLWQSVFICVICIDPLKSGRLTICFPHLFAALVQVI